MIKVAIVGTGFMAKTHADAYKKMNHVEMVAITAVNTIKGKQVAKEYDCDYVESIETLLLREDVHVIDICTPTHTHEQLVVMAAEAGKHVICEKPVSLTLGATDRMIEATKKAGVTFMVAQVVRFWPEYMKIKQLVDDGELGKVDIIYANRLATHPTWGEWFKDVSKSGGGLFDLHLHDVDYMYYLFGAVKSVYAIGAQNEHGAWNHIVTNLIFQDGNKAVIESSYQMPENYPFTMSLRASGDQATVDFNFTAGVNLENIEQSESGFMLYEKAQKARPIQVEKTDPYFNELSYFIDCIKNGKEPEVIPPEESREVLRLILAIQTSLETGEVQMID